MARKVGISSQFKETRRDKSGGDGKFTQPHSPWQILLAEKQVELDYSTREISDRLKKSGHTVSHVKIWNWLRCKRGYPGPSLTIEMNDALARCMDIPTATLARALDMSRALSGDTLKDRGLHALRRIVEESTRKTWTKKALLAEIDSLS